MVPVAVAASFEPSVSVGGGALEGLAPALGFSAPNTAYPALTHFRGFLNHLAYGAAVAMTAEVLFRLTDTAPDPVRTRLGGTCPNAQREFAARPS